MHKYNCEPGIYVDRYNKTDYAAIEWIDTKTGLSYISDVCNLKTAVEYRDMYKRHTPSDIALIKVKLIPINELCNHKKSKTSCIHKYVWQPKPNNTMFKKTSLDNIHKEIVWVDIVFDHVCNMIYHVSLMSHTSDRYHRVYGSMCHSGFVNKIFNQYQINIKSSKSFVNIIGSDKSKVLDNIQKLSETLSFATYDSNEVWCRSIYKNGLYSSYVRLICLYCEKMFDINRYIVVSLFVKHDPSMFINYAIACSNKVFARYAMFQAGYVYAEADNYEKALEMFETGIRLKADNNNNFIEIIDKFKKYYKENGTTILFEH